MNIPRVLLLAGTVIIPHGPLPWTADRSSAAETNQPHANRRVARILRAESQHARSRRERHNVGQLEENTLSFCIVESGAKAAGPKKVRPSEDKSKSRVLVPPKVVEENRHRPLAVSPDGKLFAIVGGDGRIGIYPITGGKASKWLAGHVGPVTCLDWSPDGKWIVSGSYDKVNSFPQRKDGTVRVWNVSTGKQTHRFARADDSGVAEVRFSPDGTAVLARNHSGRVGLWSVKTGRKLARFDGTRAVQIAANGVLIVSDGLVISAWESVEQPGARQIAKLKTAVFNLALSPDGRSVASGAVRNISIWDLKTGKLRVKLDWKGHRPVSIAFSPDGKVLATLVEDEALPSGTSPPLVLHFWSTATGKCLQTIDGNRLRSFRWHPDGRSVLTTGSDSSVRRWAVSAAKGLSATSPPRRAAESTASRIEKLGMEQNARLLRQLKSKDAAVRAAATLKLDNVERLVRQLLDPDDKVRSVATYRLVEIGAPVVAELKQLLRSGDLEGTTDRETEIRALIDGILHEIEKRRRAEVPATGSKVKVNPLIGMDWLVGGEWSTQRATPGGEVKTTTTTFEWDAFKRTIVSKNTLKDKGRSIPVSKGTYWWDPVKKQIRFLSIHSNDASFAEGVLSIDSGAINVQLTVSGADGKTVMRRTRIERVDKNTYKSTNYLLRDKKWVVGGVDTFKRVHAAISRKPRDIEIVLPKGLRTVLIKRVKYPKDRGTLSNAHTTIGGQKYGTSAELLYAPPIEQKPKDSGLQKWFDSVKSRKKPYQATATDNNGLLFRSRPTWTWDKLWIDRIERRGNTFTIHMMRANWDGPTNKNARGYQIFALNLGMLPAGKYKANWIVMHGTFTEKDPRGWPARFRTLADERLRLSTSFTVLAAKAKPAGDDSPKDKKAAAAKRLSAERLKKLKASLATFRLKISYRNGKGDSDEQQNVYLHVEELPYVGAGQPAGAPHFRQIRISRKTADRLVEGLARNRFLKSAFSVPSFGLSCPALTTPGGQAEIHYSKDVGLRYVFAKKRESAHKELAALAKIARESGSKEAAEAIALLLKLAKQ